MQGWRQKVGPKWSFRGVRTEKKQVGLFRRILLFDRCRAFSRPHRRHEDLIYVLYGSTYGELGDGVMTYELGDPT